MKVLFLDIDGVLNSADFFAAQAPRKGLCTEIDLKAARRLKRVVDATGCAVVLSSTWRCVPELVSYLRPAVLHLDPAGLIAGRSETE